MTSIEIVGLENTLRHPEAVTHADLAVVQDGRASTVHVHRLAGGWLVTAVDEAGRAAVPDEPVEGSFSDAALCGIGLALDHSTRAVSAV